MAFAALHRGQGRIFHHPADITQSLSLLAAAVRTQADVLSIIDGFAVQVRDTIPALDLATLLQ
jgi:hypothetical protein